MADPFVGEIRMFAGTFAPRNWALCDGQLLQVSQADALFSLLGTTYGGDGRTTFALPDLRGRIPMHQGTGPGLTPRTIGSRAGSETVTLNANEVAAHSHTLYASTQPASDANPAGNLTGVSTASNLYGGDVTVNMNGSAIAPAGSTSPQAHSNLMPALCINFIIALFGVFPSRQ